jgi:hypothetical protein
MELIIGRLRDANKLSGVDRLRRTRGVRELKQDIDKFTRDADMLRISFPNGS